MAEGGALSISCSRGTPNVLGAGMMTPVFVVEGRTLSDVTHPVRSSFFRRARGLMKDLILSMSRDSYMRRGSGWHGLPRHNHVRGRPEQRSFLEIVKVGIQIRRSSKSYSNKTCFTYIE